MFLFDSSALFSASVCSCFRYSGQSIMSQLCFCGVVSGTVFRLVECISKVMTLWFDIILASTIITHLWISFVMSGVLNDRSIIDSLVPLG